MNLNDPTVDYTDNFQRLNVFELLLRLKSVSLSLSWVIQIHANTLVNCFLTNFGTQRQGLRSKEWKPVRVHVKW